MVYHDISACLLSLGWKPKNRVLTWQNHVLTPLKVPCILATIRLSTADLAYCCCYSCSTIVIGCRWLCAMLWRIFLRLLKTRNWRPTWVAAYQTMTTPATERGKSSTSAPSITIDTLILCFKWAFASRRTLISTMILLLLMLFRVKSIFCVVVVFMVMVVVVMPRQSRILFHYARIILEKEAFIIIVTFECHT